MDDGHAKMALPKRDQKGNRVCPTCAANSDIDKEEQTNKIVGFDTRWIFVGCKDGSVEKKGVFRRLAKPCHGKNRATTTAWLRRTDMEETLSELHAEKP